MALLYCSRSIFRRLMARLSPFFCTAPGSLNSSISPLSASEADPAP